VNTRSEIRDFLTSRRARITPEDAGLKVFGARRVPGLRREEVATLAGVSVDYYNRMERGNLAGASDTPRGPTLLLATDRTATRDSETYRRPETSPKPASAPNVTATLSHRCHNGPTRTVRPPTPDCSSAE
jgi:transcriptional regulator with XRE-family HTH domain